MKRYIVTIKNENNNTAGRAVFHTPEEAREFYDRYAHRTDLIIGKEKSND